MNVELSEKEITAVLAAEFALRNSKELKRGGTYVYDIFDNNSRRIPFGEAEAVLLDLIERILGSEGKATHETS